MVKYVMSALACVGMWFALSAFLPSSRGTMFHMPYVNWAISYLFVCVALTAVISLGYVKVGK